MTTCKCSVVHVQLLTFCVILLRIGEKKEREKKEEKEIMLRKMKLSLSLSLSLPLSLSFFLIFPKVFSISLPLPFLCKKVLQIL